jgi:hypothetical protein
MCELWQTQIHDSPSDGVTTDILIAMNHVTLDIIGLAGELLRSFSLSGQYAPVGVSDRALTWMLCSLSPQGLDTTLML